MALLKEVAFFFSVDKRLKNWLLPRFLKIRRAE